MENKNNAGRRNENNLEASSPVVRKLEDPGEYLVPLIIYREVIHRCVCDMGSSLNLMTKEIATQLMIFRFEEANSILLLPNGSVITPIGALSRVPVWIRHFVMPTDFVVIDAYHTPGSPLILGRPFLATVGAIVNAKSGVTNFTRLGCRFKTGSAVENKFTKLGFQEDDSDDEA